MILSLLVGLTTGLIADANVPIDKKAMKAKMVEMAGETSKFNQNEDFPKEYFLIPKNLPFALGLVLHHPQSSSIGLSKEQIDKLIQLKKEAKSSILKKAKEIKVLELSLVKSLETKEENRTKVTQKMNKLVDTIATKKAELTKAHLQCIIDVQNILTKEQRKKVGEYVGVKPKAKRSDHKVTAIIAFPHFKRLFAANKDVLNLTKEQNEKIETEIFQVIRPKIHGAIEKAEPLQQKVTSAVLKEHKKKEDVKADLEALIDIKRDMTNNHIDALNTLAKILTKEQYQQFLELIETQKKKHK